MNTKISVYRRIVSLSDLDQSLSHGPSVRKAMGEQFHKRLESKLTEYSLMKTFSVSRSTLDEMVRKYSEQLVYQPLEDLSYWFGYYGGHFLQPGYPPLYYAKRKGRLSPNISTIASVGEGVAGFVMQRMYKAVKLARPIRDYPDIVMLKDRTIYLVDAKASTVSVQSVWQTINKELVRICSYTSTCKMLDQSSIAHGVLVGTALLEDNRYHTYITEIVV